MSEIVSSNERPKYHFCWWCSRQLLGKRRHVTMRAIGANDNTNDVHVHRSCAETMEREGAWEFVPKAS